MNNKTPLPKKPDNQKPLAPSITIINQNSTILLDAGPPTVTTTANGDDNINDQFTLRLIPLPPLIFINTHINQFNLFCESIKLLTQLDGFLCKSSVNGFKLYTYTTDSYPKTVKFLILPDHSTPVDTIKEKLNYKGFTIRNITNILHGQTKKLLPLFQSLHQQTMIFLQ